MDVHKNPYEEEVHENPYGDGTIKMTPLPATSAPNPPGSLNDTSDSQWSQYQGIDNSFQQTPLPLKPFMPPQKPLSDIKQKKASIRILLTILVVALILFASGSALAVYLLTRPQPVMAVTSQYMVGTTLAGATSTSLHILGSEFSANSPITFFLDDKLASEQSLVHSNADGTFKADLLITSDWSIGTHKLTAQDNANHLAKNVTGDIIIVHQGENHTPGPNGAPPDDASFTFNLTISLPGSSPSSLTDLLTVTSDHNDRNVCNLTFDDNQPHTFSRSEQDGITDKITYAYSCRGTYKAGKISYTETISTSKIESSNGVLCQSANPATNIQFEGTFSSATSISGTFIMPGLSRPCNNGQEKNTAPALGTATGTIA